MSQQDMDLLLWLHAEAVWRAEDLDARRARWAEEHEKRRDELETVEASRRDWAAEAARQSAELNDYADLLLTCAESPSPEHLARVLRRIAARRPQSCPFVSDEGNGCEEDEGHDGPHLRWFDELRYEELGPSRPCSCLTVDGAAVVLAGGFSLPLCAVHPEADR